LPYFYAAEAEKIVITEGLPAVMTFYLLYGFENKQKPIFKWSLNGVVLNTSDTFKYTLDSTFNISTLTIQSISSTDSGLYECQAKNLYGNATLSITVKVKSRLAPIW